MSEIIRERQLWKRTVYLNEDSPEPYKIPNCRCQIRLSDYVPENSSDKGMYTKGDLANDMNIFFNYLPESEVNRMVNCFFWCLATALKNRGKVDIKDFALFMVEERKIKDTITQSVRGPLGIPRRVRRAPIMRFITLREYPQLKSVILPRSKDYFAGTERTWYTWKLSATNQPYYYARHWRRGALFLQQVFDKTFEYTGYTDEYLEMAEKGVIEPFGTERKHMNKMYLSLNTPPYVKAAFTDELIKVPANHVATEYFTDPSVKRKICSLTITPEEAEKYLKQGQQLSVQTS